MRANFPLFCCWEQENIAASAFKKSLEIFINLKLQLFYYLKSLNILDLISNSWDIQAYWCSHINIQDLIIRGLGGNKLEIYKIKVTWTCDQQLIVSYHIISYSVSLLGESVKLLAWSIITCIPFHGFFFFSIIIGSWYRHY